MDRLRHSFKDTRRENLSLAVYSTGYEKCDPGYAWGPALRDHYLIHYVASGKGTYCCHKQRYPLEQGDLFLISPSQIVSYCADSEDPWEYYWVGFNGTEAKRLLYYTGFSSERPVIRFSDSEAIRDSLLRIYRSGGSSPGADAEMVGYLYLFLARLIQENRDRPAAYGTREYLPQALRYIQYNYANDIGVVDLARYAGVSRSQLYRAFMASFGLSSHDYLQKYRINEACSLLRRRDFTVAEVAGSVGFSDPLYFSRIFKKLKGLSPSDYQRREAEQDAAGRKDID